MAVKEVSLRDQLEKWIAPLKRRVSYIICKAILDEISNSDSFNVCKVLLHKDEVQADLEYILPYGFSHKPEKDAETIVLNINGDRNQGIIICIGDSRYKFEVSEGDVAIYSKGDNFVHLKNNGDIHINGDKVDIGDVSSVKALFNETFQTIFNSHTHVCPAGTSDTALPQSIAANLTSKTKAE